MAFTPLFSGGGLGFMRVQRLQVIVPSDEQHE